MVIFPSVGRRLARRREPATPAAIVETGDPSAAADRSDPMTEKRILQAVVAAAALVPILAGLDGMVNGAAMAGGAGGAISLDSHVRYLSGLLFGLGLLFWSTIPDIERRAGLVRALTLMVVLGGLARAVGVLREGWPSPGMRVGMAMELVVTPLICLWQARVAAQAWGLERGPQKWNPVLRPERAQTVETGAAGAREGPQVAAELSAKPLARR
jgi:hypothetical protein